MLPGEEGKLEPLAPGEEERGVAALGMTVKGSSGACLGGCIGLIFP